MGIFKRFILSKISTYRRGYASDFAEDKAFKYPPNLSPQIGNIILLQPLRIVRYPEIVLRQKALPVTSFDLELHRLLDEMAMAMRCAGGIGIAATQAGSLKRAFIVELELGGKTFEFVNPRLTKLTGRITFDEGCLSFPGIVCKITRSNQLVVEYQDRNGKELQMPATGLLAVVIQHEFDHLDGILFIDRLPFWRRMLVKRKMKKTVTM